MYEHLLVLESHVLVRGLIVRVRVRRLYLYEIVILSVTLRKPGDYALGAVRALTAVAVELVLARRVQETQPVVAVPLGHVDPLVLHHDPRDLVLELGVALRVELQVGVLVDLEVALVAEVGRVVLAVLGRGGETGDAVEEVLRGGLIVDLDLGLHGVG